MSVSDFLWAPELSFLRYAFAAGLLASLSLGLVGTFVVTRKIVGMAGAISHCVLGGIGLALYSDYAWGLSSFHPMMGAAGAALIAAGLMSWISKHAKAREDTLMSALWAIGMAVGLLFIAKTPTYVDPMVYLFGNILMTTAIDLYVLGGLAVFVVGLTICFYEPLLAVCFDEEFAKIRGVRSNLIYSLLLILTAITIVMLIPIAGTLLVIALLTLPAAVAGQFAKNLWQMMIGAVLVSALVIVLGITLSYFVDLPTSSVIILVAGALYAVSLAVKKL
jgi:zinc transport system permease protein